MVKTVTIGGASGYWGESAMATPQLLAHKAAGGALDYIVYDYLAEITMAILARTRAKDEDAGYATDFVTAVIAPHITKIAHSGIKLIANAGGVNPQACAKAVRAIIAQEGLALKVAVITGDDLMNPNQSAASDDRASDMFSDMFSGAPFPAKDSIASQNVYLGALPIAKALAAGADIVITGRCVDSALTLGPLIFEFGWAQTEWDALASGSLCGHILECGPQATGGNFTDWEAAGDIAHIGYPIAQVFEDGDFIVTKPEGTGGLVCVGTVCEQLLYEIGDPQAYILPDVVCDFSGVTVTQDGPNRVRVSSAKGYPAPAHYKTCLTFFDGYRAGTFLTFYGKDASRKAAALGQAALTRAREMLGAAALGDFRQTSMELLGAGSQFGQARTCDELVMKFAVSHEKLAGAGLFLKALSGIGLATPPGLSGFTGAGRPSPSPIVRLHSYLTPKSEVTVQIDCDGQTSEHRDMIVQNGPLPDPHPAPPAPTDAGPEVPLIALAYGRSGDKGDKANIGVIAREAHYLPYIWAALSPARIHEIFAHFITGGEVTRYVLPGVNAMNIVLHEALGGGGTSSLRNDAQGKGFAQILLQAPIPVSPAIAKALL